MTTEGFPGAPGHTLRIRRAAGGAPDVRAPRGSQRSPMNPVRQTGDPSAAQGLYWTLPLPFRDRMPGSRTHANRTLSESYRGLSKPAGVHLNFALGLSNEVGPPQVSGASGKSVCDANAHAASRNCFVCSTHSLISFLSGLIAAAAS